MKHKKQIILSAVLAVFMAAAAFPAHAQADSYAISIQQRTKQQLVEKWRAYEKAQVRELFDAAPSAAAPFAAGKLNSAFIQKGTLYFNFLRYAAGLPDVETTGELNTRAQHGAVLLAANNALSHAPSKPAGMDDAFYKEGALSASTSNISMRYGYSEKTMLESALQGCVDDNSSISNLLTVGHRQWMLNPRLLYTGFGYAKNAKNYSYITTQAMDKSAPELDYSFISWPAQGAFPNNIITSDTPWSVTLNPQKYSRPDLNSVKVEVTRRSDGKTWSLSKADYTAQPDQTGPYLNVSQPGMGVGNCIIFGLGSKNFSSRTYSDGFTVKISGIQQVDGTPAQLSYTTDIFDFEQALAGVQPSPGKGDINGDGQVTLADVLLLQRYLAGGTTLDSTQLSHADTNSDGAVTLSDVLLIQKYIAHEIPSLG